MLQDLQTALETNFGYTLFRPYQQEIIRQVLAGRDTLGVLPTGAGKSLCYQLPAMMLPRPTIVISPLIALMQDQLDGLPPAIYPHATLINSSLDYEEVNRRLTGIETGTYRLIYVAPERLRQQEFLRLLQRVSPSLVVVDEAHCISVWGHDFRPDYLFIRRALEMLRETGTPPVLLAVTATATGEMQTEIAQQLGRDLTPITGAVFRSNLRLEVFPCANADAKMRRLITIARETTGTGIVYANSRERCEQLAMMLCKQGVQAAFYHAGLDRETRKATQEKFMLGRVRVMVATVAFGMGVDKSNVRFVVHFTLPESLEAYMQEAGRAGRDGKPSRCALLIAPSDRANVTRWLRQNQVTLSDVRDTYRALKTRIGRGVGIVSPEEMQSAVFGDETGDPKYATRLRVAISMLERCGLLRRHIDSGSAFQIEIPSAPPEARAELDTLIQTRREHEDRRLADLLDYAEGSECRHVALSHHFDQDLAPCGDACDRCLGVAHEAAAPRVSAPTSAEVADVGRVILECIASLPFLLGRTGVAKVVIGAADSPVSAERCANHGTLAGCTQKAIRTYLDTLVEQGWLHLDREAEYPLLHLTPSGLTALRTEEEILANPLKVTSAPRPIRADNISAPSTDAPLAVDEDERFERLRAWRRIEAERQKVPPYVIFHDSTLRAISQVNPMELQVLSQIPGIGPRKLESYGTAVLELLHGVPASEE